MSKKLRIAAPLCGLLAVAVIALFCITGFAAGDEETSAQAVTVETMSAQGIEAHKKSGDTCSGSECNPGRAESGGGRRKRHAGAYRCQPI